jgi:hypothetical protein
MLVVFTPIYFLIVELADFPSVMGEQPFIAAVSGASWGAIRIFPKHFRPCPHIETPYAQTSRG